MGKGSGSIPQALVTASVAASLTFDLHANYTSGGGSLVEGGVQMKGKLGGNAVGTKIAAWLLVLATLVCTGYGNGLSPFA